MNMQKAKFCEKSVLEARKIKQNKWREINFRRGDVVQTQEGFDRGLVTKVNENNMPIEVMASPYGTEVRYYGGVNSLKWYKTGEHMTPNEWLELYSSERGWRRYCKDRENQIRIGINQK